MLWCVAARITPARQAQRAGSFGGVVRCCCCWIALLIGDDEDWPPLIEWDETHKNLLPTISLRQRFCAIERRRMASHSRETTHQQRRPTSQWESRVRERGFRVNVHSTKVTDFRFLSLFL